jgi:Zn-dependent M28 family amino/carboxypeptidase
LQEKYLQRSIIFIATTGEEKGLLGSTYYVDHPIFPLYKTIANINIDGIAFIDEFKSIIGIGAEYSELKNQLITTANDFSLSIAEIPSEFYSTETFNRSDQIAFAKAGIPSILILDGPDYITIDRETSIKKLIYYNNTIYHSPFDDLSINFNFKASVQHIKIISSFIFDLSRSEETIAWNKDVSYNFIRLQTKAEKR